MNGQILHNHHHEGMLEQGRMMVMDAGTETSLNYASDILPALCLSVENSANVNAKFTKLYLMQT
jgi:Xaa-Pro aminopeptidase